MKLYTAKISPYAAMCRLQIYCKNLDVDLLELPTDASWDDVKIVSPIKKIPVLVDGDTVVPESIVICEYLEDCFPQISLRPQNPAELARMRLISRIADQYVLSPLLPLFAVEQPFAPYDKVSRYWNRIGDNPQVAKVIDELYEGMDAKAGK